MKATRPLLPAVVAATGTVYGDIGTSPLYALRESLHAAGYQAGQNEVLLGVLSLIFWSLLLIVTLKYIVLILRADNDGEGGILALLALVQRDSGLWGPWLRRALALGVLGTALFYCDALITPAISVLSAVEGLELLDPGFERMVMPVAIGIVIGLFAIQRAGTARVARWFGPVMLLWFATLGVLGVLAILRNPEVLAALNPVYALKLFAQHPGLTLAIIGAVFLAVTGGEALYADMGHFGRRPVRFAWFAIVWPGLILNYLGQGALLLSSPEAAGNPFYLLAPAALLPALVLLATFATVIASQATITGAFSITRQAVQLDLLPRMRVLQTSAQERGQVYVPAANTFMLIAVVLFMVGFGSSSALAGAYGVSVIGTMLITTVFGAVLAATAWRWSPWKVASSFGLFLLIDLAFLTGNLTKINDGGWVPLLLAALMFVVFITWRDGRQRLRQKLVEQAIPNAKLPQLLANAARVPGTAVFLVSHAGYVPTALLRNLEHNHVCHERIAIVNLKIVRSPRQDPASRVKVEELMPGVYCVEARFGFMERPDVGEALQTTQLRQLRIFPQDASYFVGWHLVRAKQRPGWDGLKMRLFAWLQRRSAQAAEFFKMPTRGVMVLATEVQI